MGGFCELAIGLRAPKLAAAGAKSAIVSGGYLKYSRFRETATGDRVRPELRGGDPTAPKATSGMVQVAAKDQLRRNLRFDPSGWRDEGRRRAEWAGDRTRCRSRSAQLAPKLVNLERQGVQPLGDHLTLSGNLR